MRKYKERISVEPQLNLSGKLFNPIVGFDIYLPDADEETRTHLRNAISTEEELTRQVFSLLVMNSFISMGTSSICNHQQPEHQQWLPQLLKWSQISSVTGYHR